MHPLALPPLAMSAVNIYLAAYHLVLALRRPAVREHLPFALLCASVATYEVFCVGLYSARSLTEGVFWQGFQIQSIIGISLMTVWFVARLTGTDRRRGIRWTLRWFALLVPISFVRGEGLTVSTSTPAIKHIGGALHPLITYYESDLGVVFQLVVVSTVVAYPYLVVLLVQHHRRQPSRNTFALLLGHLAFFVGIINDAAVGSRVYEFVYVSEYSFFALTLSMAYVLLNRFVGLAGQAEALTISLERAVAQRTAALQRTLEQQRAMQRQLVDASRRSGMADVASYLLHNVGNALNGITTSLGMAQGTLHQSRLGGLSKVVGWACGDDRSGLFTDDARARRVPEYLTASVAQLGSERAQLSSELAALGAHVAHMQQLVDTQRRHAHAPGVLERTSLPVALDEALSASLVRHAQRDVEIERAYAEVPDVAVDRNKLLDVLASLLDRAWDALDNPALASKRIELRLRAPRDGRVAIEIADSGAGFSPEDLRRIFHQDTAAAPHGLRLHASACAAVELGGSLTAASDGEGRGACFTLTLPLGSA